VDNAVGIGRNHTSASRGGVDFQGTEKGNTARIMVHHWIGATTFFNQTNDKYRKSSIELEVKTVYLSSSSLTAKLIFSKEYVFLVYLPTPPQPTPIFRDLQGLIFERRDGSKE